MSLLYYQFLSLLSIVILTISILVINSNLKGDDDIYFDIGLMFQCFDDIYLDLSLMFQCFSALPTPTSEVEASQLIALLS